MFAVIVNNLYSGISGKVGFTIEDKTSTYRLFDEKRFNP
jgi:hypothetical protein